MTGGIGDFPLIRRLGRNIARSLTIAMSILCIECIVIVSNNCCNNVDYIVLKQSLVCSVAISSLFLVLDVCSVLLSGCLVDQKYQTHMAWHTVALAYICADCLARIIVGTQLKEILFPISMFMASIIGVRIKLIVATMGILLGSVIVCHVLYKAEERLDLSQNAIFEVYFALVLASFVTHMLSHTCSGFFMSCPEWNRGCLFHSSATYAAATNTCKNVTISNAFNQKDGPNFILFVIDSVPANALSELQGNVTSERFQTHMKQWVQAKTCTYLENHHASSSYTHDSFFSMLHSLLPIGGDYIQRSVPLTVLQNAGYNTSAFLNGQIGYDYCKQQVRDKMDGMAYLDSVKVFNNDLKVEEEASSWILSQENNTFFSIVYFEKPHLLHGKGEAFEEALLEVTGRIDRILHHVSKKKETIYVVTSDHGCSQAGDIIDCPSCNAHGYGVHGFHAHGSISHVPLWLCLHSASEKPPNSYMNFIHAASQAQKTSSMDILPSLIDYIGLLEQFDATLRSGKSWLQRQNSDAVASYTRLDCQFSYGIAYKDVDTMYFDVRRNVTECAAHHETAHPLDMCLESRVPKSSHKTPNERQKKAIVEFMKTNLVKPYNVRKKLTWIDSRSYQICV